MYPNKFAALVPVAGGIVLPFKLPSLVRLFFPKQINDILNSPNPYDALAVKIGATPVWNFHGASDDTIPVTESRNIVAALRKNDSKNVNHTEYPKTGHNEALFKAFAEPELYKWLASQQLKKQAARR